MLTCVFFMAGPATGSPLFSNLATGELKFHIQQMYHLPKAKVVRKLGTL